MNRFIYFLIICLLCLSITPLYSEEMPENSVFKFPLSGKNSIRFTQVCSILAKHSYIKGNFNQEKIIKRLNRSLISNGNFIIAAEYGIVWETLKPFPSTMAVGRDYIIQSTPGSSKTKLDAAGNETFIRLAEIISAVFSGNSSRLINNFNIYFTESGSTWTVGLIPSENAILSFVSGIVMSGDSVIKHITLYEQNSDIIYYELSHHTFPGALTTSEKKFFSAD